MSCSASSPGWERWAWAALLGGLTAIVAALFAYPLSHLLVPMSFNYSEGWNAYWQEAARVGQPLYASPPAATIANYPPLSFHLVALLSRVGGWEVWQVGRVLGALCLLWSAVNVAVATRMVSGSRMAAALAGLSLLLFVALMTVGRVGTDDPNFLALALSTLGVCAFLRAQGRAGWIAVAALFLATALFVKNAVIAFAIAGAIHLAATRRWRLLGLFALSGVVTSGVWLALTLAVDGRFFLAHLLAPRALSRDDGIASLSAFVGRAYAPLLLAAGGLALGAGRQAAFAGVCLLCALVLAATFVFGNGVAYNIYYEAMAALAIVAASTVAALRRALRPIAGGVPAALSAGLLVVAPALLWAPGELYGALGRSGGLPARAAAFAAGVAAVRATEGPALCESLLMCFQAGKRFEFDPYFVKDQIAIGRFSDAEVAGALAAKRFAVVEIGEDDGAFALGEGERLRFTAASMAALLQNYRVVLRRAGFAVLIPN